MRAFAPTYDEFKMHYFKLLARVSFVNITDVYFEIDFAINITECVTVAVDA